MESKFFPFRVNPFWKGVNSKKKEFTPLVKELGVQESQQEVKKNISLVKIALSLQSVPSPFENFDCMLNTYMYIN